MAPKLRLNLAANHAQQADAVKAVAKRKAAATETIDEAWARILAMKNSAPDQAKLIEVKSAMEAGLLGRDPSVAKRGKAKAFSRAEALRLYKELAEKQREETLRKMVEETPSNYRMVLTQQELDEMVERLATEPIIAVDTETTGLDVYVDVIVGVSFSLPNADIHYYVPIKPTEDERAMDSDLVLTAIKPIIESDAVKKVLHNAIFDIQMFRRHGLKFGGLAWDTMTAMHLLNENERKRELGGCGSFKLKDLAPKYLGAESDTFDTLFGKDAKFAEIPLEIAFVYAAKDTHLTWRLYEFQHHHMSRMPTVLNYYNSVEVPLLYVIADLEANGFILDLEYAKQYGQKLRQQAEELKGYLLRELSPHHESSLPLNLNSTQQLKPALSKAIGKELPNLDAKKTLKPLRSKYEIIDKLLDYRGITKLSGTYIDKLPGKQNAATKRWHSRFDPMGTVTGRFSSGKDEEDKSDQGFNAQNQPEEARPMFLAPPGKVLVGADFKAQEIRCVAYLSGEPVLIDAFKNDKDPYAMMASVYYKRPWQEVHKNPDGSDTKERKEMKVVWLATLYGMSDYSLAEMLKTDKKSATAFKEEIFGGMPKLDAWLKHNEAFVQKHGFVWADNNARKRRLPDAKLTRKKIPWGQYNNPKYEEQRKHNAKIGRAMRQATNARVQGSSSIQTKVTMLRAHEYCANKSGWALWSSVHDELLFEVPEDFTREEAEDIRNLMVNSYLWGDEVPNGTDIEVMRRWGEGVPVSEWFKQKEESE